MKRYKNVTWKMYSITAAWMLALTYLLVHVIDSFLTFVFGFVVGFLFYFGYVEVECGKKNRG